MIIPVKCFTCGKVLANKWVAYEEQVKKLVKDDDASPNTANFDKHSRGKILDDLGLTKICCRRHMLGHVNFE